MEDKPLVSDYALSKKRFFVLGAFCLFSAGNCGQMVGFSNVIRHAQDFYNVDAVAINATLSQCYFVFFCLAQLGTSVLGAFGLKKGLLAGISLSVASAVLRLLTAVITPSYPLLFVAQFLGALASIFIIQVPPMLALAWFDEKGRTTATAFGTLSGSAGIAFGLVVPPQIVGKVGGSIKEGFLILFIIQLAILGVVLILFVFLPERPEVPPSPAAAHRAKQKSFSDKGVISEAWESTKSIAREGKKCLSSIHNTLMVIGGGIGVALGWTITTLMFQMLQPFGISGAFCGILGLINIGAGVPCALVACRIVDRYRNYKLPVLGSTFTSFISYVMIIVAAFYVDFDGFKAILIVIFVVNGITNNIITPVSMEALAEMTFPQPEYVSASLIMMWANLFAGIIVLGLPALFLNGETVSKDDALHASYVFNGIAIVAVIAVGLCKVRKLRQEHEDGEDAPTGNTPGSVESVNGNKVIAPIEDSAASLATVA